MTTVRLQKVLARAGVASRRAAEELITSGRVRVDGKVASELGTKVDPRDSKIEVDGKRVFAESLVYVVLHKPRNVVATMSDPEGRPTVREILKAVAGRVYPVGRLDFATSGVLLATNDGDFAAALLHPRKAVPKTYVVKVHGEMEEADLERWAKGIQLEDGMTLPAKVKFLRHEEGKTWFELTITEGRNQQIRRMGEATGFRVMRLARLSFARITSEGLKPGAWRYLTPDELADLKEEHGVPKRIVTPPGPARHFAAKARSEYERPRPAGEKPKGGGKGGGTRPLRPGKPGGGRGRRAEEPRGSSGPASRHQGHPRYGGGSPVRRDINVTEDWGGGVQRGSSGSRDGEGGSSRPDGGGRGGRTRTTGTGGGIGAGEGGDRSYRVKGRRGW